MTKDTTIGGILAGGLSRRMGGIDKALLSLENKSIISHVADRLVKQVDRVIINTNSDFQNFKALDYPLVSDAVEGYAGPLAGIHALMGYAKQLDPEYTHIATVAADTPFFPGDFVDRCLRSLEQNDFAVPTIILAKSNQNRHPVFGLWPLQLFQSLETFLTTADTRKVMAFVQMHTYKTVDFPFYQLPAITVDPFFNINKPDDLLQAATIVKQLPVPH